MSENTTDTTAGDEADEVHQLWSDAVADLCNKIGVDPKSFDWSPRDTDEETISGIVGNIIDRLLARLAAAEQARADHPDLDATDGAHPAWWRGHDYTAKRLCQRVNEILDGNVPHGVANEPWESTRRRLLSLVQARADAESRLDRADSLRMAAALRRLRDAGNVNPQVEAWMRGIIDEALPAQPPATQAGEGK
jgi:hypothetical protein